MIEDEINELREDVEFTTSGSKMQEIYTLLSSNGFEIKNSYNENDYFVFDIRIHDLIT